LTFYGRIINYCAKKHNNSGREREREFIGVDNLAKNAASDIANMVPSAVGHFFLRPPEERSLLKRRSSVARNKKAVMKKIALDLSARQKCVRLQPPRPKTLQLIK